MRDRAVADEAVNGPNEGEAFPSGRQSTDFQEVEVESTS
jgi:hypothetical protein